MIDHDRLFKELLSNFFPEFIELFLPDVSAYWERDSIEFLPQEVFTDVTKGERKIVDLSRASLIEKSECSFYHSYRASILC